MANSRIKIKKLKQTLEAVRAMLDDGECRGDEDCDHCQIIYHMIDPALSPLRTCDEPSKEGR